MSLCNLKHDLGQQNANNIFNQMESILDHNSNLSKLRCIISWLSPQVPAQSWFISEKPFVSTEYYFWFSWPYVTWPGGQQIKGDKVRLQFSNI